MQRATFIPSGFPYTHSLLLNAEFLPNIPPARPVLLLLDGHSTHYTPEAVCKAHDEGVIMLCLPPHTTHTPQPLDVSFFWTSQEALVIIHTCWIILEK